jgi:hypothetical protein
MRPDEAQEVMAAVEKSDETQSQWIRSALLKRARKELKPK